MDTGATSQQPLSISLLQLEVETHVVEVVVDEKEEVVDETASIRVVICCAIGGLRAGKEVMGGREGALVELLLRSVVEEGLQLAMMWVEVSVYESVVRL